MAAVKECKHLELAPFPVALVVEATILLVAVAAALVGAVAAAAAACRLALLAALGYHGTRPAII